MKLSGETSLLCRLEL